MSQTLLHLMQNAGMPNTGIPREIGNRVVTGVAIDSRRVTAGGLFLALKGEKEDGFAYVDQAVKNGATAILYEGVFRPEAQALGVPAHPVPSLRSWAGPLLHAAHGLPGQSLFKLGITGTNGKTTITRLCSALLSEMGHRVIRLGTIDYTFGNTVLPSPLTTPGPDQFYSLLSEGLSHGCTALAMEVSSHALVQDRVRGVAFQRAIFTNLTQDHLDFHRDLEEYFQAKSLLFSADYLDAQGVAILNIDSPYGARLAQGLADRGHSRILTFSQQDAKADVLLLKSELTLSQTHLTVTHAGHSFVVESILIGAINIENLMAAISFGLSLGLKGDAIAAGLRSVSVPGRNELIPIPNGAFAVVDYAHTPDALDRVLQSLRPLTRGRLHCVFGCGGDRDKTKRPIMGGIAAQWADSVIVTSDNPRTEKPDSILADIVGGIPVGRPHHVVPDRREAILLALKQASAGDCVLVAGKGHEDYQIVGKIKHPFSDQAIVREYAESLASGNEGRG